MLKGGQNPLNSDLYFVPDAGALDLKRRMAKKGTLFERVVADIVLSFDSTVEVSQGSWVAGPDGRRDRDVSFTGVVNGSPVKVLIECKDYNRRSTGPVNISLIDAFDSKRKDLGIDLPIICSNAGFTEPAIHKAQRVGISTVGALRMGDARIRFEIHDVIYFRRIVIPIEEFGLVLNFPGDVPEFARANFESSKITYDGLLLQKWAISRIHLAVGANPIVNGYLQLDMHFRAPLMFEYCGIGFQLQAIGLRAKITGAWYRQNSRVDASSGFYDWVRKRARVGGGLQRTLSREIDYTKGTRVEQPPDDVLRPVPLLPDEVDMGVLQIHGPVASGLEPPLDEHIIPEDLILKIPNLEPAAYRSTPGFVPLP